MRALSNKARIVLDVLREEGDLTCGGVADEVMARTPCGVCAGTGDGDDPRYGCRSCYGHGHVLFGYSDAYVALKQLRERGLVSRRPMVDQFGDALPTFLWFALAEPPIDEHDPLEAMFSAPAFGAGNSHARPE